jgi:hypothetical protein
MASPSVINGPIIDEIIDGIMEARVPEAKKKELLERMRDEGGVVSAELRNDLATLFESAAQQERDDRAQNAQSVQALLNRAAPVATAEELAEEDRIAAQTGKEQKEVADTLDKMILQMRGDVLKMESDASGKQERVVEADNAKTMAQIRKDLGLDDTSNHLAA